MKTRFAWKPVIAGVLLLLLNLPVFAIETVAFIRARLGDSPDGNSAAVFVGLTAPAVLGGLCAVFKRAWWLALAGSVVALALSTFLATPPLLLWLDRAGTRVSGTLVLLFALVTLAATALIALSKGEFAGNRT